MGRWTAAVVVGIAILVVVGIADALRGDGGAGSGSTRAEPEEMTTRTTAVDERLRLSEQLADWDVRGLLYATVRAGAGCDVLVIALPTLSRSVLGGLDSCRIRVSPSGLIAGGGPCRGGRAARFSSQTQIGVRALRGCAPAWRPNGRLTFVNPGGDVVELVEPCASIRPCLRVVVPRGDIPGAPRDLAWLDEERLAVLFRGRFRRDRLLAIFEDGRLVATPPPCCLVRDYLRALAGDLLLPGTDGTVLQFDARGRLSPDGVVPPAFADGSAFTGSPDGRWVASTLGGTVQVYPVREGGPLESIPLDLRAVDLGWS